MFVVEMMGYMSDKERHTTHLETVLRRKNLQYRICDLRAHIG
jgi:hypothetical protein